MKRLFILLFLLIASPAFAATGTIILPVQAAKLPTSNPCAIDAGEVNWRLLCDATTDESGVWQFRMPTNYASGLVVKIQYSMASATANSVTFEGYIMAVSDNDTADVVTESYDTVNFGSATVPGTAGYIDEISINLTNADSLAAGDFVKFKFARDANGTNGTDNATGDAEILNISLEYTTN